ncbi:hypothetical protein K461DRAFT_297449 [Myriangium duriaei CBS 260.36]|uniref:Transcription factor CBF/NF-Y/archaeal histone domain-containing protein n=1 Tax=Myriangium duriaei CBS 260.36 TaxID=1168546 RepID=A0A9P4IWH3_9PEZI|nr:hypothetical protein K461DRAFT_297449 [Myriangium duriaei CBS 260.36]
MPYNNAPIAPTQEITGTVSLPLTRVKKIIHADDDIANCSNNAAFAIAVATEQFLQYLVEQTHHVVKAERKPRRNIQYRDVANAVARHDNLEFLTDVVPRTVTVKAHKERVAQDRIRKLDETREKLTPTTGANGTHLAAHGDGAGSAAAPANGVEQEVPDHAGPEVMDIDNVAGVDTAALNGNGHG